MSQTGSSPTTVTVIGGGIAGLVAAIEVAESGGNVRLLEARRRLGGRAASSPSPWVANLGPHSLYTGTELWEWLRARGLHRPSVMPTNPRLWFRWNESAHRVPPAVLVRVLATLGAHDAPVDLDLRTWAEQRWGADGARALAGLASSVTFDHDPGRLSAAFVAPRIRDIVRRMPTPARYVTGGWGALVERVGGYAAARGVAIETDAKVEPSDLDDLNNRGPVIVAVEPGAARRLLGEDAAPAPSRKVALLDVGFQRRRNDPYLVWDLDQVVFASRATAVVSDVAPRGHELIQLAVGMAPHETLEAAELKLERTLDDTAVGWRERVVWRRRSAVRDATGAVDLPGTTWRDRPPIARADGLWTVGDWVAAPGHLASVGVTSAQIAAREALAQGTVGPAVRLAG